MKECPKCGANEFQTTSSKVATGKFDCDGILQVDDSSSEEELIEVQCEKCGHCFPEDKEHGGFGFEWDWE